MRIVIVGAGTVGSNIAKYLTREEHEVVVVDLNPGPLAGIEEEMDVQTFCGNACDPAVLKTLDIANTDLLLAATEKDETNMMAAFAAKAMGCRRVAARVRSRFYYDTTEFNFRHPLGIDLLLSPELATAIELATFVSYPNALALTTMGRGRIQLRTIKLAPKSDFVGKQVRQLVLPEGTLVAGLRRGDTVMITRGNTMLEANDRITLIGLPESLDKASPLFDLEATSTALATVAIAGAGETGLYLADLLEKRGHQVTLIENDRARAEMASERLAKTRVLHGDATDVRLLREERIGNVDYYIALTGDDENNIMSSLLAKELGAQKTACLIDRPDYTRIVERIGIDVAISPRFVVANRVLALVKRGRISSVTLLEDGELEVSEYQAQARSPVVGQALKDVEIPVTGLIGAVLQGGQVAIPRGDYIIKPGAIVIGVTLASEADKFDRLFADQQT